MERIRLAFQTPSGRAEGLRSVLLANADCASYLSPPVWVPLCCGLRAFDGNQGRANSIDTRLSAPYESCPASPLCFPIGRATSFAVLRPDGGHPWFSNCLWMICPAVPASLAQTNQYGFHKSHCNDLLFEKSQAGLVNAQCVSQR